MLHFSVDTKENKKQVLQSYQAIICVERKSRLLNGCLKKRLVLCWYLGRAVGCNSEYSDLDQGWASNTSAVNRTNAYPKTYFASASYVRPRITEYPFRICLRVRVVVAPLVLSIYLDWGDLPLVRWRSYGNESLRKGVLATCAGMGRTE